MPKALKQKYLRSVDEEDINEKQMMFVMEYIKDLDAKRAGLAAGYGSADSGHKLLAKPNVARQIAVELGRLHKAKAITNELVLEQLYFALSRTSDDFIDPKTGMLVNDLRLLSDRAKNMVEGVKQQVERWTDGDGEEHVQTKTEIKFVSKQAAIDLAMRHKGLIEAHKQGEVHVTINLNDFLIGSTNEAPADPVEERLRVIECRADKVAALPENLEKPATTHPTEKSKKVSKESTTPHKKKPLYTTNELIGEE